MKTTFQIENLKCGGCANTIVKGLTKLPEAKNINVDVETSSVTFESENDISELIHQQLSKMGYPVVGDKNTISHKAKSFVSCAVGRMSDKE